MNITIRQINKNDWLEFREIRLKALQSDPKVFGSYYEREVNKSKQDWIDWVGAKHQAIFIIYDDETPIGMTGIYIPQDTVTKTTAVLWGSWLESKYRRKGISELMYKARIDWAKSQPEIKRIEVSHRESNVASKYANQKHGFKLLKEKDKVWQDGVSEKDVIYSLDIDH
jgi:RimJ/RimL family protein N-acetyltransferase